MEDTIILILIFFFVGLSEVGMSIPMILGVIPPNWYYGFRVSKTVSNEKIWYQVNNYFGKDSLIAGVIVTVTALLLWRFGAGLSEEAIVMISLIVILIPMSVSIIRGFLYLNKLE
jgi:hypothetical protein